MTIVAHLLRKKHSSQSRRAARRSAQRAYTSPGHDPRGSASRLSRQLLGPGQSRTAERRVPEGVCRVGGKHFTSIQATTTRNHVDRDTWQPYNSDDRGRASQPQHRRLRTELQPSDVVPPPTGSAHARAGLHPGTLQATTATRMRPAENDDPEDELARHSARPLPNDARNRAQCQHPSTAPDRDYSRTSHD